MDQSDSEKLDTANAGLPAGCGYQIGVGAELTDPKLACRQPIVVAYSRAASGIRGRIPSQATRQALSRLRL
jgi:hypothetical protein